MRGHGLSARLRRMVGPWDFNHHHRRMDPTLSSGTFRRFSHCIDT
jgi:hypothetical protein